MIQIIDNKLYDTDKCEKIHEIILDGMNCEILKTPKGSFIGFKIDDYSEVLNVIIDERRLKYILGYKFPELYIELFGEVEEG